MQRWKNIGFNIAFALNCMLLFLLLFESRLSVPAWVQTIGRMHPLLLHFPIVLLLLAAVWELMTLFKGSFHLGQSEIGDSLLLLTALTAVMSALMGLLLSKEDGYSPEVVAWHKWGGILLSVLTLVWYAFRERVRKAKLPGAAMVSGICLLLLYTGHLGADITHGDNFLLAPVSKDKQAPKVLLEDAVLFTDMVNPILQSKCISCHNEHKAKGELVMASYGSVLKGGKDGVLWDSSKADFGLLLNRVHLPLENKKHMPPLGKPQLTEEEISILYYWIKSGGKDSVKVQTLPETDTLRKIAASIFNTIETDEYHFKAADDARIKALRNNYRQVTPLSEGSPALGVSFFSAAQYTAGQLKELLTVKDQIVSLNLDKMPVTDADLQTIAQFSHLRKLNLSFTNISGAGLAAISGLKELKQLSVSGTHVDAASLSRLSSLPKLTALFIWNTPAQTQNLLALQQQLKQVRIETGFNGDTLLIKLNKPLVQNEEEILTEPVPLKLKHYVKGASIRYTMDGSVPDSSSALYVDSQVLLNKNVMLKARAFKPGWISSDVAERYFYKAGYRIDSIRLLAPAPDSPYKIFSPKILVDGKKGEFDFGNGKWMGFRGKSMEAMIYFDTIRKISSVTISTLENIGGYILPPQRLELWAGSSPRQLRLIKLFVPAQPTMDGPAAMKGYELRFDPIQEKYLKVVVVPVPKLPSWHKAKGEKGWAFVDELFFN